LNQCQSFQLYYVYQYYSIFISSLIGLIMDPKWRIIALTLMAITFILLVVSTMSTNWREDHEGRIDVFITHGLWRICRDIKFGATLDHKCMSGLANDAPGKFSMYFCNASGVTLFQPGNNTE